MVRVLTNHRLFSVRGDTHRGMGKLENRYLMKNWPGMLVSLTINQLGVFSWQFGVLDA
jgi:hypothetical protein